MEEGWNEASNSNLLEGQVKKYGQCSSCNKYFWVVLDENGEIIKQVGCEKSQAKKTVDTDNGHDYELSINWVEIKDESGNIIGYDTQKTSTATLKCTREGCIESRTRWNGKEWVYDEGSIKSIPLDVVRQLDEEGTKNQYVTIKLDGTCENGTVTYTASVKNGNETLTETKTVKVNGHVASSEYSHTSVERNDKQVPQHAQTCMYCGHAIGNFVDCTPTVFTDGEITAENHKGSCVCGTKIETPVAHTFVDSGKTGDINVDGYVHHGKIIKCSICGYETIETGHEVKKENGGHYCVKCGDKAQLEKHVCTEWKKTNNIYESTCTACKEKINSSLLLEVLGYKPNYADNTVIGLTVIYPKDSNANFSQVKEIPEGVKVIFETGSTCTLNTNVTVKGIVEFESEATLNENNNNFILDKGVSNASVTLPAGKTMGEKISSQNDFAAAVGNENVGNVVVDGKDIVLTEELANSVKDKDLTISEGATLTVAKNANFASNSGGTVTIKNGGKMVVNGKLGNENLTIEGEGTVELANDTDTDNGTNLTNVFKAGAKNVELASNAKLQAGSETNMSGNLTIDEGVTFTTEANAHITDKGNPSSSLTIKGTWKVEGEIRDLERCTFGEKSIIELASKTEENNGKSLVICAKSGVPNVKLDENAKLNNEEKLEVKASDNVKLDLNSKTVSNETKERIAEVAADGTLTISNGTITDTANSSQDTAALKSEGTLKLENVKVDTKGYGVFVGANGKLTINGGTFTSSERPCIGTNNSTTTNSDITVTNATLTTEKEEEPAVFLPAKGEATFENCTIQGGTAIEAVGLTTLNLKGTTKLKATRNTYTGPSLSSGEEASGNPLLIVSRKGYSDKGTMTVNVHSQVTFETAGKGGDFGDIEVKVVSSGISNVKINHGTSAVTVVGKGTSPETCQYETQKNDNLK